MLASAAPIKAADFSVVVTSKSVHSLTAAVMDGVAVPRLLVDGQASPHTFALKPSGAAAIQTATLFVRVGDATEPFTTRLVKALPSSVMVVTLDETPGLVLLDRRTTATFEPHDHDHAGHTASDHAADAQMAKDGHIWLDPLNAMVIVDRLATLLAQKDPEHAARFMTNAAGVKTRLAALATDIASLLKPVQGRPFVVSHDAYQYFEARFGVWAAGAITISADVSPSAKRLSDVRARVVGLGATCVFSEPFVSPNLVAAVTEGTNAHAGTLDPEGLTLDPGPELYFTLMRALASNVSACLKPST